MCADPDERMMANDIDKHITEQYRDTVYETGLLSGKLIRIEI